MIRNLFQRTAEIDGNSAHQVANLDGTTEVRREGLPAGPMLLVNNVVDSQWTFTVAGCLLERAGVAVVYPIALALNSIPNS